MFDALGKDELAHIVDLQLAAFDAAPGPAPDHRHGHRRGPAVADRPRLRPGVRRPAAAPARADRHRRPARADADRRRGHRRPAGHGRPRRGCAGAPAHRRMRATCGSGWFNGPMSDTRAVRTPAAADHGRRVRDRRLDLPGARGLRHPHHPQLGRHAGRGHQDALVPDRRGSRAHRRPGAVRHAGRPDGRGACARRSPRCSASTCCSATAGPGWR